MVPRPPTCLNLYMIDSPFLRTLSPSRFGRACKVGAVLLAGLPVSASFAADFTWANLTGFFTDPTKWVGNVAPLGTDPTDVLTFGGDVATQVYVATSNSTTNPFLINQLVFTATNPTPGTGASQTIDGTTTIKLGGTNPTISQNGSASITIKVPIQLGGNLTLSGTGVGVPPDLNRITLDGTLTGTFNIVKVGSFTFRFGSATGTSYSQNTWYGGLTINDGTIRYNNNAYSAPTALRGNPVTMNNANALISTLFKPRGSGAGEDPDSSLRMGTLNGTAGTIDGHRETISGGVFDSIDIVIATLDPGSFGGTINNNLVSGGDNNGRLIVRGTANQTFTGTLILSKDIVVGGGAGITLAGNTSLSGQTTNAAVVLNGGVFTLDNTTTNNNNRLRDASASSTGLEPIGGGKFSLIGNAAGTTETIGRLQLGSTGGTPTSRSGALTINVTTNGGTGTTLIMQSFARNIATTPLNTVNFTANDGSGSLGTSATGARILFNAAGFAVPIFNGLIASQPSSSNNIGWATVNGRDFATYDLTFGVKAATTVAAPAGSGTGSATSNALLTTNLSLTNASGYSLNSLKIDPPSAGLSIDIASTGNFFTYGVLLAGSNDFAINASSSGRIASIDGLSPRYFHVQNAVLTVGASLAGTNTPVVKSGPGLLNLTSTGNVGVNAPLVINEGTVRATPGSTLIDGELRFRGGVLEITGGTFARQLGGTAGTVNWSGVDALNQPIAQEQGSGGFAAVGSDATVDLVSLLGTSEFAWEDTGFVNSGHALVFGSTRADAKVTWVDNLSLTALGQVSNYNAREIRVVDNPSSTLDAAVLSGKISGSIHDDLLKTGTGTLILSSTLNDYQGATIVHQGALLVNGTNSTSFLSVVRNNATLGGNGTVGKVKVESGGTIAPGNAIGNTSKLTTGDLILSDGAAKLAIEIGGSTIGGNSINGYDQIAALGEVVLNGGTLVGAFLGGFIPTPGDLFFIVDNDGSDPVQGTFAGGSLIFIGGEPFNVSYTGNFTGDPGTSTFIGGNDIVLQYIPEPTSAALLACGAAALGLSRRRRS
jgi:autotransporter-associated beta strand protein